MTTCEHRHRRGTDDLIEAGGHERSILDRRDLQRNKLRGRKWIIPLGGASQLEPKRPPFQYLGQNAVTEDGNERKGGGESHRRAVWPARVTKENISAVSNTYYFAHFENSPTEFIELFEEFYGPTMNADEAARTNGKDEELHNQLLGTGEYSEQELPLAHSFPPPSYGSPLTCN